MTLLKGEHNHLLQNDKRLAKQQKYPSSGPSKNWIRSRRTFLPHLPPQQTLLPLHPKVLKEKKKKKQYKAKSSYIADDEFEDILATGWFYKDSNGDKQGPFTTKEMKEWFVAGFFDDDLLVKRIHETEFGTISERPDFKDLERRPQDQVYVPMSAFQAQQQLVTAPNPYYQDGPSFFDPAFEETPPAPAPPVPAPVVVEPEPETIARDYAQKAYFTTLKGRFSATDQESYWSMKGLPSDKDGRMLSNYFDYEAYQEQMRNAKPAEKKKVSKAQIKAFRKKKVDKKRRRILMM